MIRPLLAVGLMGAIGLVVSDVAPGGPANAAQPKFGGPGGFFPKGGFGGPGFGGPGFGGPGGFLPKMGPPPPPPPLGGFGPPPPLGGFGLWGPGIGIYVDSPFSNWYTPWSTRYGYRGNGFFTPSVVVESTPARAVNAEYGLQIMEISDGGSAKKAQLRVGDVILSVDKTRTQSFEELQQALAAAKGQTDIVFLNGESKKVEKLPLTPVDGKIGVAVVPVRVQ